MKYTIVTGGNGFIGSHVMDALAREAPDLPRLSLGITDRGSSPDHRYAECDVRDRRILRKAQMRK